MDITRAQVSAAFEALGLDKNLTHAVTITPRNVDAQIVITDPDGVPEVRFGALHVQHVHAEIQEATDVDA